MMAAARVVNHEMKMFNFVPMAALGFFAATVIKDKKYAFLLPVMGQLLADICFALFTREQGFYGISQIFTYVALVGATSLGFLVKKANALNILGGTLAASVVFFLVSNLGYFAQGWNGYSASAFVKTYKDALPFFRNSLLGDLLGSTLLFGGYFLLQRALTGKMAKSKA